MLDNQCISKNRRTDYQPGRDMLSELPLSIIHIILALVPIRDAVKTSILSRQWRYTWTSLPWLEFEEYCPIQDSYHYKSIYNFEDRMENFISSVLVLHKGPIDKFKLSVPFIRKCRNISVWLLFLFSNDIRELIIDMDYHDSCGAQELPSSIYSCKKLIKLELNKCDLDLPPLHFKGFLFLRCLCLRSVFLSTNDIESLVANCPLLEKFALIDCGNIELRINAPNLKFLDLVDDYIEMSVYAPLLTELSIELQYCNCNANLQEWSSSVCNYTDFIGAFTNLELLHGGFYLPKYLSMGIESCHQTLVFPRLKYIELEEVDFEDIKSVSVVARLIVGSPNLEMLKIENRPGSDGYDAPKVLHVLSFSDLGCAPDFKLEKLSLVKLRSVTSLPHEMALISFLLEHSPVLKTMTFGRHSEEEEQKLRIKLQGINRASPNANLLMTY